MAVLKKVEIKIPESAKDLPPELRQKVQQLIRTAKRNKDPICVVERVGLLELEFRITEEETVGGRDGATYWTCNVRPVPKFVCGSFNVEAAPGPGGLRPARRRGRSR